MISSMLVLMLTARWLGPEGRGEIVVITGWVTLFATFGHLSLGQVALHEVADKNDPIPFSQLVGAMALVCIGVTVIGWTAVAATAWLTGGSAFGGMATLPLALGFLALPFMIWEHQGSYLLMALDRLAIYNTAQVVGRLSTLLLTWLLLLASLGVNGALVALAVGQAVVALTGVHTVFEAAGRQVRVRSQSLLRLLAGGGKLHLNAVGAFLFASANVLIIAHYHGSADAAFYQLAFQLMNVFLIVPQAVAMVLYSKLSTTGADGIWGEQKRLQTITIAGMVGVAVIAALLAPIVVRIVAGADFEPAVPVFRIYLLSVIASCFNTMMAVQWIARGYFMAASVLTLIAGVFSLLLNLAMIPRFGIEGAAWATVASAYLIPFTANLYFAVRVQRRLVRV